MKRYYAPELFDNADRILRKIISFAPLTADTPDNIITIYTPKEALQQITCMCERILKGELNDL
jgi:hypothetical protein